MFNFIKIKVMITKEQFIDRASEKFGDKFNYDKLPEIIPAMNKTDIEIECPIHGYWITKAKNFLDTKCGCPKCARNQAANTNRNVQNKLSDIILRPDVKFIENPLIVTKDKLVGTVYCFINTINNKIYIGKVIRHDFNERFNEHRSHANSNCVYFYRAIDKYGWEAFDKYIIFQTESLSNSPENKQYLNDIILEKEKYYIKLYKTNDPKYGYNLTEGGDGIVGFKFSEEVKKKMSEKHSGKNHWNYGKTNSAGKRVLQYDFDGNLIKIWDSMSDVERAGITKSCNISLCCNGKADSAGGFVWIKEFDDISNLTERLDKAKRRSNDKSVLQFDINGNQIAEYISAAEAARINNCDGSTISGAAKGKFDWGIGFIWIYKKEYSDCLLQQKIQTIKEKHKKY